MQRFAKLPNPYFIHIKCLSWDILIFHKNIISFWIWWQKHVSKKLGLGQQNCGIILHYIGSSKESENVDKSLCAWDNTEQTILALKTGIVVSWNQRMESGTLPENTICEHSSPSHLQIQVISYKEEAICMHLSSESL